MTKKQKIGASFGEAVAGTLRDVALTGLSGDEVAQIDAWCENHGMSRREWALERLGMKSMETDIEKYIPVYFRLLGVEGLPAPVPNTVYNHTGPAPVVPKDLPYREVPERRRSTDASTEGSSGQFIFHSTPDGKEPSGRRMKGTFRSISFVKLTPDEIDKIDAWCIMHNTTRHGWAGTHLGYASRETHRTFIENNPELYISLYERIGWADIVASSRARFEKTRVLPPRPAAGIRRFEKERAAVQRVEQADNGPEIK